ncbi:MAG: ATP-dependent zinc protease [Candidatus Hydrogenedentes bacterium]|nr:ATP-dependent zinc protease [Candidatus Hydrogenedentota bacterium]
MAKKPLSERKTVIGWSEHVDFPDWRVFRLSAKVDTGARTSALHVEDFELLPQGRVRFKVVVDSGNPGACAPVTAAISRWGRVRSSNGAYSMRCFVKTRVRIGPVEKEIEISLVSRERMAYRMLLGRQALGRDFLVYVGKRRVATRDAGPRTKRPEP